MNGTLRCKQEYLVGWWWPILMCAAGSLLFYLIIVNDESLPKTQEAEDIEQFNSEFSSEILRKFTNLGPRVVGTIENEVETPKLLLEELNAIKLQASPNQVINITVQKGSGGFHYRFLNVYYDIQNVIVVLKGWEDRHSILVNCHYDTAEISPGASDDMVSCAVMIEVLRLHSIRPVKHRHNIIFLFNGAEESGFQGSHLFMQHEWAKKCRIFLNLGAFGSGGRNILFQAGPNHPWLFKYYAKFAPHPHGQIFAEEMYQNGMIPLHTDFSIFQKFGKMPGLDFAFWRNGHVYHTDKDLEEDIPIGSHQHLGDNLKYLLLQLAEAPELDNMEVNSEGQMVYYDYLGWFMIYYSKETGIILNSIAVILGFATIVCFIVRTIMNLHNRKCWFIMEFSFSICTTFIALGTALAFSTMIAYIANNLGKYTMIWYANPILIIPFYWIPLLVVYTTVLYLMEMWRSKKHELSVITSCQMYLIASQIPWLIMMVLLTYWNMRSAAVFFLPVLSSALANLVIHSTRLYNKAHIWIWVYLLIHLPALAHNMYNVLMFYMFFIPIFGRSGMGNHDLIMSYLSTFCFFYTMSFVLSFVLIVKKSEIIISILAFISFIIIVCTLTTDICYPFSLAKPQRHVITHTNRQSIDKNLDLNWEENGIVMEVCNSNSPRMLPLLLGDGEQWLPAGKPDIPDETELLLKWDGINCTATDSTCELKFILKGPDHLVLKLFTYPYVRLIDWSLPVKIPEENFSDFYINVIGSQTIHKEIMLKFHVPHIYPPDEPIIDVNLEGTFLHHKQKWTEEFNKILSYIDDRSSVDARISAVRAYEF